MIGGLMDRWEQLELDSQSQQLVLLQNEAEILLAQRVGIYDG